MPRFTCKSYQNLRVVFIALMDQYNEGHSIAPTTNVMQADIDSLLCKELIAAYFLFKIPPKRHQYVKFFIVMISLKNDVSVLHPRQKIVL